ncbi:MAG: hypothetical protein WBC44_20690 [Planctomycetaceae bacterium]
MPRIGLATIARLTLTAAVFVTSGVTVAQSPHIPPQTPPRFYPLRHDDPPGVNAYWAGMIGQPQPSDFTFIRLDLPSTGTVEVYGFAPPRPVPLPQGWCGLSVGRMYRLKIAGLEEFPGAELYPTVEVLDRTHPPPGREAEFAVPIRLTTEEIEQALGGQLVTKVVYVEQPQLASPFPTEDGLVVETLTPDVNLLKAADQRGRPLAIVRLGARTPDPMHRDPLFYGPGGPVILPRGPQAVPADAMP